MFDDIVKECAQASQWPANSDRSRHPSSYLQSVAASLEEQQRRLFITSDGKAQLHVMEMFTGKTTYGPKKTWKCINELQGHLDQHLVGKEKDPMSRFVFMTANHSQAPLDCTMAMFRYLFTFHCISPEVVELVLTFGRNNQRDFYHTRFIQELQFTPALEHPNIPELGRSGTQSQVGYKVFAMEQSDVGKHEWTMRQTVIYHSLDLRNGRMFWLIIKANNVIRDRIKEAAKSNERKYPDAGLKDVTQSLNAAFKTHQSVLQWSCEGWRWYLSELDEKARVHVNKTTAAPIPSEEEAIDPIPNLLKTLTMGRKTSTMASAKSPLREHAAEGVSNRRTDSEKPGMSAVLRGSFFKKMRTKSQLKESQTDEKTPPLISGAETEAIQEARVAQTLKRREVLKDFKIEDYQSLHTTFSRLKEAKMAMAMNGRIIHDLNSHYQDLFEAPEAPPEIISKCLTSYRDFKRRATSLSRLLESECLRADTLIDKIRDGIGLYDSMLQAQNKEVEKLFAMNAQVSSTRMEESSTRMEEVTERMHDIAKATERDTTSMHIITFFTLVFLPGTFLGTFFSTPVIGDPQAGSETSYSFNGELFWVFIKACLPMMAFTIAVWFGYMRYKASRRTRKEKARMEPVGEEKV